MGGVSMEKFGLLALGGGGGGGLPPVTSSDNGKVLAVVDGTWAAADNDFVVTFTKSGSTWSADKLITDIADAIIAKKRVYGKVAAHLVSSNSAFINQNLVIQLGADSGNWTNGYQFSGSYQTGTTTLFVNIVVALVPQLNQAVTAYIKEIELAPASLVVTYTIVGQPVAGVYPLSADKTLAEIHTAIAAGREVYGLLTVGTDTLRLPVISYGATDGYVEYSGSGAYGSSLILWRCLHESNGANAYAHPINTTVMSYNTTSGELAITNVPEVSA